MLVTDEGMVMDSNESQSEKALSPMLVTEDGIPMDFNELQS